MFDLLFFIKSCRHLLRIDDKTTQLKVRLFQDFFGSITSKLMTSPKMTKGDPLAKFINIIN